VKLLLPGMYVAADSALHRLDPRVKMGGALLLTVAVLVRLSTAPLSALLHTLRAVLWVGFFMFFFYLFTTPGRTVVVLGGVGMTWEGLLAGATQVYRLCLLVTVAALLTFTTSPGQLAHGLEALLEPLRRVGLPVREMALVLTIALRFVPTLFDEIDKIGKAQRARGADFRSANPWRRVRAWVPMFVPIFVSAFRRAEELAVAMEARGFRTAHPRTRLHRLHLTRQDLLAAAGLATTSLLILALNQLAWPPR
jgi:energy-coupling factor transport system permease protein